MTCKERLRENERVEGLVYRRGAGSANRRGLRVRWRQTKVAQALAFEGERNHFSQIERDKVEGCTPGYGVQC